MNTVIGNVDKNELGGDLNHKIISSSKDPIEDHPHHHVTASRCNKIQSGYESHCHLFQGQGWVTRAADACEHVIDVSRSC